MRDGHGSLTLGIFISPVWAHGNWNGHEHRSAKTEHFTARDRLGIDI